MIDDASEHPGNRHAWRERSFDSDLHQSVRSLFLEFRRAMLFLARFQCISSACHARFRTISDRAGVKLKQLLVFTLSVAHARRKLCTVHVRGRGQGWRIARTWLYNRGTLEWSSWPWVRRTRSSTVPSTRRVSHWPLKSGPNSRHCRATQRMRKQATVPIRSRNGKRVSTRFCKKGALCACDTRDTINLSLRRCFRKSRRTRIVVLRPHEYGKPWHMVKWCLCNGT